MKISQLYAGFFVLKGGGGKLNGLSIKQKKFADEYIISGNATESYKKAGYRASNDRVAGVEGHKLLKNPKIVSYLDEEQKKIDSEKIADKKEVLEFLTAVMRGEVTEPILVLDGAGYQKVMDAKPNVSTRKSAAVDLGKRYGLFVDKQEITQKTIDIKVGDWDAED